MTVTSNIPSAPTEENLGHGLDFVEEGRNDYAWLAESFGPHLRGKVVEHGAGLGTLSALLLAGGRGVTSLALTEPDGKLAGRLETRFRGDARVAVFQGTLE